MKTLLVIDNDRAHNWYQIFSKVTFKTPAGDQRIRVAGHAHQAGGTDPSWRANGKPPTGALERLLELEVAGQRIGARLGRRALSITEGHGRYSSSSWANRG